VIALAVVAIVAVVAVAAYSFGSASSANPFDNAKRQYAPGSTPVGACYGSNNNINAQYVIMGGGFGGLATAYRMLKPATGATPLVSTGSNIVIIEAETRLGGRVDDVLQNGAYFGNGPLRIGEAQAMMRCIAKELNVELEYSTGGQEYWSVRGAQANDSADGAAVDQLAAVFPGASDVPPDNSPTTYWYDFIYFPDASSPINFPNLYANFVEMVKAALGENIFNYLRGTDSFRTDYSNYGARYEWDTFKDAYQDCCSNFYPVGGWSQIIRALTTYLNGKGVRIFTSSQVSCVQQLSTGAYQVYTTNGLRVDVPSTGFLFNAMPAGAWPIIGGNLAAQVSAQGQFQSIKSAPAATAVTYWATRWWEQLRTVNADTGNVPVLRLLTDTECFNRMEFHNTPYTWNQKAVRTAYDDGQCVEMWKSLLARGGTALIQRTIMEALNRTLSRFNLPAGFVIPQPIRTVIDVHDPAWHYIGPGYNYTACDLLNWAPTPLPGKRICHIGESYGVIRTAWTDAAYRTTLLCLRENFGMNILPFLGCQLCGNNEFMSKVNSLGRIVRAPMPNTPDWFPLCGNKCTLPSTDYCHNLYPRGGTVGTQYEPWGEDPSCDTLCNYAANQGTSLGILWGTCELKKKRTLGQSKRSRCFGTAMGDGFATRHCAQNYTTSRADMDFSA